jgi:hypothetical protein
MRRLVDKVDSPFKHPFAFTSRNADNICSVNHTHLHAQTVPILEHSRRCSRMSSTPGCAPSVQVHRLAARVRIPRSSAFLARRTDTRKQSSTSRLPRACAWRCSPTRRTTTPPGDRRSRRCSPIRAQRTRELRKGNGSPILLRRTRGSWIRCSRGWDSRPSPSRAGAPDDATVRGRCRCPARCGCCGR